jgi:hypothetical protein
VDYRLDEDENGNVTHGSNAGNSPTHILESHRKDASERVTKIKQVMSEETDSHQKSWEALNNSLALFSSGTIALSITYLGYLQSAGIRVLHPWILFSSWACLLVNIPMALFVPFVYTFYAQYARGSEYNAAVKNLKEIEGELLPLIRVADMKESEKPSELERYKTLATEHGKAAKRALGFSNFYYRLWRVMGFS